MKMEVTKGWIKLHRSLTDHWIWEDPEKAYRWVDLLLMVNHKEQKVNISGSLYVCRRGQSIRSLGSWGKRWGVSKDVARGYLLLLQKDKMIKVENIGVSTRITVCQYEEYQGSFDGHTPHLHTNKNDNKDKKNKNRSFQVQGYKNIPGGLDYDHSRTF